MIEIVKSSEFNARAVKSIDLANKIPGYNFSYPVLNTIDICNILMIGGSIFIGIGEDITSQYLEVLEYCKHEKLPIVNMFVSQETSDEQKLYQVINEAMDFATREGIKNDNKTALVFASRKNIPLFINIPYMKELILDDYTELHIAKSHLKFFKN